MSLDRLLPRSGSTQNLKTAPILEPIVAIRDAISGTANLGPELEQSWASFRDSISGLALQDKTYELFGLRQALIDQRASVSPLSEEYRDLGLAVDFLEGKLEGLGEDIPARLSLAGKAA